MLRLKANFMWPAMWGNAFYADDTNNSKTADMMGMACVVFIGRRDPDPEIIELANELEICVLLTRSSMFTTCGLLFYNGLNGGVPSELQR